MNSVNKCMIKTYYNIWHCGGYAFLATMVSIRSMLPTYRKTSTKELYDVIGGGKYSWVD